MELYITLVDAILMVKRLHGMVVTQKGTSVYLGITMKLRSTEGTNVADGLRP